MIKMMPDDAEQLGIRPCCRSPAKRLKIAPWLSPLPPWLNLVTVICRIFVMTGSYPVERPTINFRTWGSSGLPSLLLRQLRSSDRSFGLCLNPRMDSAKHCTALRPYPPKPQRSRTPKHSLYKDPDRTRSWPQIDASAQHQMSNCPTIHTPRVETSKWFTLGSQTSTLDTHSEPEISTPNLKPETLHGLRCRVLG